MIKSQSKGNSIAKRKYGKKTTQPTKIIYKKTIGKRAKQGSSLNQPKDRQEITLNRNTVYLPEFEDYDPLWRIQRKNPTILFG